MAGAGRKVFSAGDVLTASQVQTYLQDQAVMYFGSSAARTTGIGTANYSEGMVTYLADTNAIEYYDGSVWNALPTASPGLVHINTTNFSAVSSVSVSSFANSSLYRFYKILLHISAATADCELALRVRETTTDRTDGVYQSSRILVTTSTVTGASQSNATYAYVGEVDTSAAGFPLTEITIKNLNFNQEITYNFVNSPLSQATARFYTTGGGYYGGTTGTTINGISILPTSGNITGTLSVFGYKL